MRALEPGSCVCLYTSLGEVLLLAVVSQSNQITVLTQHVGHLACSWSLSSGRASTGCCKESWLPTPQRMMVRCPKISLRTWRYPVAPDCDPPANQCDTLLAGSPHLPYFPAEAVFLVVRDGSRIGFRSLRWAMLCASLSWWALHEHCNATH